MDQTYFFTNGNRHFCIAGACAFICVTDRRVGRRRRLDIAKGENHKVAETLKRGAKLTTQSAFEEMYKKALILLNR